MKKPHIVLILSIVIAAVFYYFMTVSSPEKTIKRFEKAYNKLDVNEMLDCFDPTYSRGIKAGLSIISSFTKVNPNDILDNLPLLYEISDSILKDNPEFGDAKAKLKIEILSVQRDGRKAEVETHIILKQGINHEEITGVFYMVKKEGKWYINDLK